MATNAADVIYDCIVLGAGIAGVTAARNLQAKGLSVLLLEGADRIGGRMYSKRDFVKNPNYVPNPEEAGQYIPIEAGAEYVHVEKKDRYGAFWDELSRQGFSTSKFHKTGSLIPPDEPRTRTFFPAWKRTLTALETLADPEVYPAAGLLFEVRRFNPIQQDDIPARAFAQSLDYTGRGRSLAEYTLSAHTPGLLDTPDPLTPPAEADPTDTISIAGISSDRIPDQLLEEADFRLEQESGPAHKICGYDTLPRQIADEFVALGGVLEMSDAQTTQRKVVKVERTPQGGVQVTTQDGRVFSGRSAVCTFSVGMLDPDTGEGNTIFGELLTAQKRAALESVKMGPITKFSLEFKERVWNGDGPWAGHMAILAHPEGDARTFFSAFPDQQDGPHVLTGLLMSKDHNRIKDMSDEEATQHLLDVLHDVFDPEGNRWTPELVLVGGRDATGTFRPNILRQDWSQDPFSKGGNSFVTYLPSEQRKLKVIELREALKTPLETLPVFWAGEATASAYDSDYQPLSVHGAYISGVRVAEDVEYYLTVANGQANQFDRYYRDKYPPQTHTASFWDGLLSKVVFGGRPEEEAEEEDARDSSA
ncbi:MAG: FAD-dependent oxidoreductase [Candidatus Tectomicrobia bacterium]|nr:FAD-dependent oxidoreductase [Candidatus Tectomicrobia bacterium]